VKQILLAVAVLSIVEIVPCSVYADIIGVTGAKPQAVFADPSDVVIQADTAGKCGSFFFIFKGPMRTLRNLPQQH
jgi:hypothetical protein